MISPPLPGSLNQAEKTAGVGSTIRRVLFGKKRLTPAEEAYARKYVTRKGAPVDQTGNLIRNMLVGSPEALRVMHSRYNQGGLLGEGGLIRGELALDPELIAGVKRVLSGQGRPAVLGRSPGGGYSIEVGDKLKSLGLGANWAMNAGFGLGLPYFGVKSALEDSSGEGVGRALGEGVGFLAAGPLGLVGLGLGGALGGSAGGGVGAALSPSAPPSTPRNRSLAPPLPPAYQVGAYRGPVRPAY